MIATVTALLAFAPTGWVDLLTRPVADWDARFGKGKVTSSMKGEGGFTVVERSYPGRFKVTFVAGKPSGVEFVFPTTPSLTWLQVITKAGLPTTAARLKKSETTTTAEVANDQFTIAVPKLPKGTEVFFLRRHVGSRVTEQILNVFVPRPLQLTPDPSERKAILDATRDVILRETKQRVIFRAQTLRSGDGWAFLGAEPRTPSDKPADWKRLNPAAYEADAYDPVIFALLQRTGLRWKVITLALGPTDVPWEPWAKEFGAPEGLFKLEE